MAEKPKMKVGGLREYIELEEIEARAVQLLKSDVTKPDSTPFSIDGVWSGTKGDIKFVVFPKKEKEIISSNAKESRTMTDEDAKEFETEYKESVKLAESKGVSGIFWLDFYLEKEDAVRLDFSVAKHTGMKYWNQVITNVYNYERYSALAGSYTNWKAKKEWAEKNILKNLEETANKIDYDNTSK